eukprot:Tbor_TRINITY_DN1504_c0_g1::TRINITY_DN1504_c0_g1_i1::g.10067::m.10067
MQPFCGYVMEHSGVVCNNTAKSEDKQHDKRNLVTTTTKTSHNNEKSPSRETYYGPIKVHARSDFDHERRQQTILESIALLVGSPIGAHVIGTSGACGGGSHSLAGVSRFGQPSVSSAALQEVLGRVEGVQSCDASRRHGNNGRRVEYSSYRGISSTAKANSVVGHSTGEMPHIFPKGLSAIQRFTLASAPALTVTDERNMISTSNTHANSYNDLNSRCETLYTNDVVNRNEGRSQLNGFITHKPIQSLWALLSMGADANRAVRLLERE